MAFSGLLVYTVVIRCSTAFPKRNPYTQLVVRGIRTAAAWTAQQSAWISFPAVTVKKPAAICQSTPTTEEPLRRATSASRAKAFFALMTDFRTWRTLHTSTAHSTSRGVMLSWIKPCAIIVLRIIESALSLLQLQTLTFGRVHGEVDPGVVLAFIFSLSLRPAIIFYGTAVWDAAARRLPKWYVVVAAFVCIPTRATYCTTLVIYVHNRRRQNGCTVLREGAAIGAETSCRSNSNVLHLGSANQFYLLAQCHIWCDCTHYSSVISTLHCSVHSLFCEQYIHFHIDTISP